MIDVLLHRKQTMSGEDDTPWEALLIFSLVAVLLIVFIVCSCQYWNKWRNVLTTKQLCCCYLCCIVVRKCRGEDQRVDEWYDMKDDASMKSIHDSLQDVPEDIDASASFVPLNCMSPVV